MNRIYRLSWSSVLGQWVPVSELGSRGRPGASASRRLRRAIAAGTVVAGMASLSGIGLVQAAPTGGQVTNGAGSISQQGDTTTINQSSQNLSLSWQSFNVAAKETVNFQQPNATAIAVNRINSSTGSEILGHLNANGQVYLINPHGVLFGQNAQINVAGLVASTLDIADSDLNQNSKHFQGDGTGAVVNKGHITATDGGTVALLGNTVSNQGVITAHLGSVALGAGSAMTLTFDGNKLLNLHVDQSTLNNLAENKQLIVADGGQVLMTAGARDSLLASVVNNTGVIQAQTVENHNGVITLMGGMEAGTTEVVGTLDASAPNGGDGGFIETSAAHVHVADSAKVTTQSVDGKTGSWLIDPHDYTVAASGDQTGAQLSTSLGTTNVTLQSASGSNAAGSGDVNINDAVNWSANTSLTLTASNSVNVNADITATGTTAGLIINPNTANGGEAASGSGHFNLQGAAINLPNVSSSSTTALMIGGTAYTVINSLGTATSNNDGTLQGMKGGLSGHYALGSDIDATATSGWNGGAGFTPIGNLSAKFVGTFDGLGHSIGNLTINRPTTDYVGLFGYTNSGAVLRNIGLEGGSVRGGTMAIGSLVGYNNFGVISNGHATGTVRGGYAVGGLVGANQSGVISNSYATGSVTGSGNEVGGLVGENVYAAGVISNSYATGAVHGLGLVGGLVGSNSNFAVIRGSYASGAVGGSRYVGGLVGEYYSGTLTNNYWNTTTSGTMSGTGGGAVAGVTGLTTTQMQTAANFAGFNFTTTPGAGGNNWVMVDTDGSLNNAGGAAGATFPMLASEYGTTINNVHQLQLMAMNLSDNYTLGRNIDAANTATTHDVWNASTFIPVGNYTNKFTGNFDGLTHTISGLTINLPVSPAGSLVGLFGFATGTLSNIGLVGVKVTSNAYCIGGLAGTSTGTINNSYATGSVTGYASYVGGLVGGSGGTISSSHFSGSVSGGSGGSIVGGLVARDEGTISGSYATGSVTGTHSVGGLVGYKNNGAIRDSYATSDVTGGVSGANVGGLVGWFGGSSSASNTYASGSVSGIGSTNVGGLVGNYSAGTVANSFWDTATTGQASSAAGTGLTTAQMQTLSSFSTWRITNSGGSSAVWRIYEGHTNPLLEHFLTPLTVTANAASKTYDGLAYSGGNGVVYSTTSKGNPLGTVSYSGTSQGARNTGSYAITAGGLYSSQQGYDISFVDGSLTITPASLTISGITADNKVYDGTTAATLNTGSMGYSGLVSGDLVSLGGSGVGTFSDKNVGTGKTVTVSGYTLSGADAGNYTLAQPSGLTANITPATLTLTGITASNKTYDGSTSATLNTGMGYSGLVSGDSVSLGGSGVGTFSDKNVGTGKTVTVSGYTLSGADAGNYTLAQPSGLTANITPATLTATASPTTIPTGPIPTLSGTVSGFIPGDTLANSTSGTLQWVTNAPHHPVPGQYAINAVGLSAKNYVIDQARGNATALNVTTTQQAGSFVSDLMNNGVPIATPVGLGSDSATGIGTGNPRRTSVPAAPTHHLSDYSSQLALRIVGGGVRLPEEDNQ